MSIWIKIALACVALWLISRALTAYAATEPH